MYHQYNDEVKKENMKPFSKLHEKIKHKYEEMQKKLEKSKSFDSLLVNDSVFVQQKFASNMDLSDASSNSSIINSEVQFRHTAVIEDEPSNTNLQFAYIRDVSRESNLELALKEDQDFNRNSGHIFHNDFMIASLESLNEVGSGDNDEFQTPSPSPSAKISIRDKIGSQISVVKEKRRQRKKEKLASKDKMKESREKVEKFVLSNTTIQSPGKAFKKIKVATVSIALIEVTGLEIDTTEEKLRFFHCRFKLGTEKHKSKLAKPNAGEVKYQELFNLSIFDETLLEIWLYEKDTIIGRSTIDLSEIQKEETHQMRLNLNSELETVEMFILLTVSGYLTNTTADIDEYQEAHNTFRTISKTTPWYPLKGNPLHVGFLSVTVYGAKGVSGTECYCILELDNKRLQTHTDYKTNDPNWTKTFTFTVDDITSILEVTVHDEKRCEDVGKVLIPLLTINTGELRWYALKDQELRDRAKGNNPRILIEMSVTWSLVKASARVINPKEVKYLAMDRGFDRRVFARNISRAKAVITWVLDAIKVFKTCFEWESNSRNIFALTIWILFCWFFKMWMLPLLLLIPFVWYKPANYIPNWKKYLLGNYNTVEEAKTEKEEKAVSLRQKINNLQEMVQTVQNAIGQFACLGERIKNLFNFSVPYLSGLAMFIILMFAFVMYIIPIRFIFIFWGIHKYTRKILRPDRIPNNEILDLLSRVPDDDKLAYCEKIPLEEMPLEDAIEK